MIIFINYCGMRDILLMLANIFLSAGYLTNFFYRIATGDISYSEIFISVLSIVLALAITFHFFPAIAVWNLINVISLVNYAATAINGFFLIRNAIVPPCKKLLECLAGYFGFNIGGHFFTRKQLSPQNDRFAIDRLFRKHYKHDLSNKEDMNIKLTPFNNMINKLCEYVNKYNEDLFGSISNSESISNVEKLIAQLSIKGNSANCITFFQEKINFKQTKINLLKQSLDEIDIAITDVDSEETFDSIAQKMNFFGSFQLNRIDTDRAQLLKEARECLANEIARQEKKLNGDGGDSIGLMQCLLPL